MGDSLTQREIRKSFQLSDYGIDTLHSMATGEFEGDIEATRKLNRVYVELQQIYLFELMTLRNEEANHDNRH